MSAKRDPFILSLDIGTSSVRSRIFDGAGWEVESAGLQVPYNMTRTADGGEFIDADTLCELVFQAIDQACSHALERGVSIHAVSACTFWHNLVGLDAEMRPCMPLLNWSDTRPERVLPDLAERLDSTTFTQRTGCPFHASYLPAKILWVHREMPEWAHRVRYWMSFGEYLYWRITAQRACSFSMASASGLLDSAQCVWDETTLEAIPASIEQLSPLRDVHQGERMQDLALIQRWPQLWDAVWFPATGDGACSNVGSGCAAPNRVAVMVGTSGAMRAVWKGEFRPPPAGLWCYRIDGEHPIQGGALSNGGNLFDWMRNTIQIGDADDLETQLQSLPPDGHGLTILPFLAGQRSPRWNPHSAGTIHGLRLSTQPAQIVQAGLEAIAYRFRLIHELLCKELTEDHVVVATGGGLLRSPTWIQIMADVLGHPVRVSEVAEASCRGAAVVALQSLGVLTDIREADPCFGRTYLPREDAQNIYNEAFQRHVDFEFTVMPYTNQK